MVFNTLRKMPYSFNIYTIPAEYFYVVNFPILNTCGRFVMFPLIGMFVGVLQCHLSNKIIVQKKILTFLIHLLQNLLKSTSFIYSKKQVITLSDTSIKENQFSFKFRTFCKMGLPLISSNACSLAI